MEKQAKMNQNRPLGITTVAVLMILFGLAEVVTGFTHNFLGLISTSAIALSTYGATGIGILYAIGGLLLLTMKTSMVTLALACLVVVIVGHVSLVIDSLHLNTFIRINTLSKLFKVKLNFDKII